MFQNNMEERAQAFASHRARLRKEYLELKEYGATNIDVYSLAESLNLGEEFKFYMNLVGIAVPTSAEAERGFSTLTRLRIKLRRRLIKHHPHLMSLSVSSRLLVSKIAGYSNDDYVREIVKVWGEKPRRKREADKLRGRYAKKARENKYDENMEPECNPESESATSESDSDDSDFYT